MESSDVVNENKRLVAHFYDEVWNRGNIDVALEACADDYVRHDLRPTTAWSSRGGSAPDCTEFRHAFPDLFSRLGIIV